MKVTGIEKSSCIRRFEPVLQEIRKLERDKDKQYILIAIEMLE